MKRKSVFYLLCVPAFLGLYGLPTLYICRNGAIPLGDAIRKGFRVMRNPKIINSHLGVSGILFMMIFLFGYTMFGAFVSSEWFEPYDIMALNYLVSFFVLAFVVGLPYLNYRIAKREWKAYRNQDKPYLGFMPPAKSEFSG